MSQDRMKSLLQLFESAEQETTQLNEASHPKGHQSAGHFADKKYTDKGLPKPFPKLKDTSTGKVRPHPADKLAEEVNKRFEVVFKRPDGREYTIPVEQPDRARAIAAAKQELAGSRAELISVEEIAFTEDLAIMAEPESEHDDGMAKNHVHTIMRAAQELDQIIDNDAQLPQWIHSKITTAKDYLDTVRDYLQSEGEGIEEGGDPNRFDPRASRRHPGAVDVAEGNPDVMRHTGDKTVKVVKRGGKPVGEIGIDSGPGGNGDYYVKLYDGSYDAAGFSTAEEALAELKYAVKSAGSGPDTSFGGPGGWTGPVGENFGGGMRDRPGSDDKQFDLAECRAFLNKRTLKG